MAKLDSHPARAAIRAKNKTHNEQVLNRHGFKSATRLRNYTRAHKRDGIKQGRQ